MDYRVFDTGVAFEDYLLFMQDAGWTHIWGSRQSGMQYFLGDANITNELFSDIQSQVDRLKRIKSQMKISFITLLPIYVVFFQTIQNYRVVYHLDSLFLTPGLWEKQGSSFWFRFLFDLPFAAGRLISTFIFPIYLIIYGIVFFKPFQETKQISGNPFNRTSR
ncbi:DUF2812 domain-containing protein [Vagococcus acidifermentans]|nr:DUF2812 domain-containing protein [Vagococcus acidifermentans]